MHTYHICNNFIFEINYLDLKKLIIKYVVLYRSLQK